MTHHYERDNYTQTVESNSASVPGEILLYGFTVYNAGEACFIQLFDDGYGVPDDGAVPAATFPLGTQQVLDVYYGEAGRWCRGGVTITNSSTDTTKTIGPANVLFDIQYARRNVPQVVAEG